MRKINLLIVGDQPVFLTGLHTILDDHDDIKVLGEASDGKAAIAAVEKRRPDVVIMAVSMPDKKGIEATRQIIELSPQTKVLALAIHSGKQLIDGMLKAGAAGYLLKDNIQDELLKAIRAVFSGDMYLDSSLIRIVLDKDGYEGESEGLTILNTKLHRPKVTDDIITRSRIIEYLESNTDKPFSLVSAPAGYGKSIAVSQWLENTKSLHTWLSLDEDHSDLRTFLLYLCAAVEKIFPNSLEITSGLIQSPVLPPLKVISNSLINELDMFKKNFILVLDDYHHISDENIHQLLDELLSYPPEHMHLAILTRVDPPLKINSLLAHGRMTEIRMIDLSFNDSEIAELFYNVHKGMLNPVLAKAFNEKTEGWIVGLKMAFLKIKKQEDVEQIISELKDDIHSLSIYLIQEVIDKQPEEVQDLILKTAVLDRFCLPLIDAVTESGDKSSKQFSSESFLDWLIKSNLFIIELDDDRKWFRYHHLFQDMLKKRLQEKENASEISNIHRLAGIWFEEHHHIEEAIRHNLAAGNPAEACNIIERHRMTELDSDRWYVVQRWLAIIPEEHKPLRPDILLSEAWSAYENFQFEKIPGLLDQVKDLVCDDEKGQALLGEYYLIYGLVYHWSGNGDIALQQFQQALELLPDNRKLRMGMLHLHIALARGATGEKDLAFQDLDKLLLSGRGSAIYFTRLLAGYFYVNMFAANLHAARSKSQQSQKLALSGHIQYTHAMSIAMEGISCFHAFELEDARDLFIQAEQQRYILHRGHAIDALAALAITYELMQQPAEADKTLVRLDQFARELEEPQYGLISSSCHARISILRGNISAVMEWEKMVDYEPSFAALFVWIEVPILTKARVLIAFGSPESLEKAGMLINTFLECSRKYHLNNHTIEALVLNSILLKKEGNTKKSMDTLAEVMVLAVPGRFILPFVEAGSVMAEMLQELPEDENLVHFIQQIKESMLSAQPNRQNRSNRVAKPPAGTDNSITFREKEIIQMLAKGLRNKEIADSLFLAEGTVKKHIYNIYQKWEVKNRIAMLTIARESGMIDQS